MKKFISILGLISWLAVLIFLVTYQNKDLLNFPSLAYWWIGLGLAVSLFWKKIKIKALIYITLALYSLAAVLTTFGWFGSAGETLMRLFFIGWIVLVISSFL